LFRRQHEEEEQQEEQQEQEQEQEEQEEQKKGIYFEEVNLREMGNLFPELFGWKDRVHDEDGGNR